MAAKNKNPFIVFRLNHPKDKNRHALGTTTSEGKNWFEKTNKPPFGVSGTIYSRVVKFFLEVYCQGPHLQKKHT